MNSKQRLRNQQHFINATKTIIETEGIDGVSARKVSTLAGFSYATIYNYFNDINSLLTYTAVDYLQTCHDAITDQINVNSSPSNVLIEYAKTYFKYMVDHPNIFKVIFINKFGDVPKEVSKNLAPKPALAMQNLLNKCNHQQFLLSIDNTFELLSASMHGKLMFIIHERTHLDITFYLDKLEQEIRLLIGDEK